MAEPNGGLRLAMIKAYGPDDTLATKLVVTVPGSDRGIERQRRIWVSAAVDVRAVPGIYDEVLEFVRAHGAEAAIDTGRIHGCPHRAGEDYPLGRDCPHCPYWAGRDPATLMLRKPPEPTMDADTVVDVLLEDEGGEGFDGVQDQVREAIRSADAHRRALVDVLLAELEERLDDPWFFSGDRFPVYAFLLLAKWREPRAYPVVVRWLSLPYAGTDQVAGDLAMTHGARILAGVCDGDLAPLLELAIDEHIDEEYRSVAVRALALLGIWRELPREQVVDALSYLARVGLERKRSKVWLELVDACQDVEALEVVPALRFASADRLIDRRIHPPETFELFEECSGCWLDVCQMDYPPIADVLQELVDFEQAE